MGRARPVVKAKAKARGVVAPRRGALKRPASAIEGELGEEDLSEAFREGREVEAHQVKLTAWKVGERIVITEGVYWEEKVKAAGAVKELRVLEDEIYLNFKLEGTQSEALVRWSGGHPATLAEMHLCKPDCVKMSKDGLIHALRVKRWKAEEREPWMDNLTEAGRPRREEEDELRRVKARP